MKGQRYLVVIVLIGSVLMIIRAFLFLEHAPAASFMTACFTVSLVLSIVAFIACIKHLWTGGK